MLRNTAVGHAVCVPNSLPSKHNWVAHMSPNREYLRHVNIIDFSLKITVNFTNKISHGEIVKFITKAVQV